MRRTAASKERDAIERLQSQIQAEQKLKAGFHFSRLSAHSLILIRPFPFDFFILQRLSYPHSLQVSLSINSDSWRTSFWLKNGQCALLDVALIHSVLELSVSSLCPPCVPRSHVELAKVKAAQVSFCSCRRCFCVQQCSVSLLGVFAFCVEHHSLFRSICRGLRKRFGAVSSPVIPACVG